MKDDIITKSPLLGLSHSGSSNLCSSVPDAARRERYASFDSPKCFQLLNSFMFSKRFMFGNKQLQLHLFQWEKWRTCSNQIQEYCLSHFTGMFVFATGFDFSNARFIIKNKIFCSKNINLLCFFSCFFFFNLWRVITNFFYLISLPPSSYLTKLSFVSLGLYDLGRKTRYIS